MSKDEVAASDSVSSVSDAVVLEGVHVASCMSFCVVFSLL